MTRNQNCKVADKSNNRNATMLGLVFCLPFLILCSRGMLAQSITRMPSWVQHDDPFAKSNKTDPTTSAAIAGIPSGRITLTMTCRRSGYRTNIDILEKDRSKAITQYPSTVTLSGSITGASLDVVEANEYYGWDGNSVPGYIKSKFRLDSGDGLTGAFDAPDSHHFIAKPPASLINISKSKSMLLGFAVNGQDIALQISLDQPLIEQYILACLKTDPNYVPELTPAQKAAAAAEAEAKVAAEEQEKAKRAAEEAARQQRRASALTAGFSQVDGPVDTKELISFLLGKTVVSKVDIGSTAPFNGREIAVTTAIYPDGSEEFVLGTGIGAVDRAPQYHTYNKGLEFRVDNIVPKYQYIELHLVSNLDPSLNAAIKFFVAGTGSKVWQKSLTNRQTIDAIEKFIWIKW